MMEQRLIQRNVRLIRHQHALLTGGQRPQNIGVRDAAVTHRDHEAQIEPVVLIGLDGRDRQLRGLGQLLIDRPLTDIEHANMRDLL